MAGRLLSVSTLNNKVDFPLGSVRELLSELPASFSLTDTFTFPVDVHSAVPDTRYTLRFHSLPVHPGFLQPGPVKDHTVYFVLGLYMRKHTNLNIQV